MIIDSHAHYAHSSYSRDFRYLTLGESGFSLAEGNRECLFQELAAADIPIAIEPAISLDSCNEVLDLAKAMPGRVFPAVGLHPTRAIGTPWARRKELISYAKSEGVIAIGELGLDYHYKREEQHRLKQHLWFLWQLDLAWNLKKPLILHVRDAHPDALRILKYHPARKLGGVVHCFHEEWTYARKYLDLGFHIGIGGSLLQPEERAKNLIDAIPRIPLERILLETDAPYILPWCKDVIPSKQLRRARNTSLILPAVAEQIAALKGISREEVERQTTENTIRLFGLVCESAPTPHV